VEVPANGLGRPWFPMSRASLSRRPMRRLARRSHRTFIGSPAGSVPRQRPGRAQRCSRHDVFGEIGHRRVDEHRLGVAVVDHVGDFVGVKWVLTACSEPESWQPK